MVRVAVASSSPAAAEAGVAVAANGGNAVDAALGALAVSMVNEPGICSPMGGAFITVQGPGMDPVTVDGNVAMPGAGLSEDRFGGGAFDIHTAYGGGVDMTIGYGSVAVPGALAAMADAAAAFGAVPLGETFGPAIDLARAGFPLRPASAYYLDYVHLDLYGWHPASFAALHDEDGELLPEGAIVHVDGLADTLAAIAADPTTLYGGELGEAICDEVLAGGGILTLDDLRSYRAIRRPARVTRVGDWTLATNPPPAIGGTTLSAMLALLTGVGPRPDGTWADEDLARVVAVQTAVLGHRRTTLDVAPDLHAATTAMLDEVDTGTFDVALSSPSTVHTSVVDADGLACAVTASAGYGSGAMPAGTGLWLNNCLGEQELNCLGFHRAPVGQRLASNMAPSVARHADGRILAIGSPGADRITTAILSTMLHHAAGRGLHDAIAAPRLHVQFVDDMPVIGHEEDLPGRLPDGVATRSFHRNAMFFGGVGAAMSSPVAAGRELVAAADPRRAGGAAVSVA